MQSDVIKSFYISITDVVGKKRSRPLPQAASLQIIVIPVIPRDSNTSQYPIVLDAVQTSQEIASSQNAYTV